MRSVTIFVFGWSGPEPVIYLIWGAIYSFGVVNGAILNPILSKILNKRTTSSDAASDPARSRVTDSRYES